MDSISHLPHSSTSEQPTQPKKILGNPQLREEESASLERLLASEMMTRAPRLRAVLQYLIKAYMEDRSGEINEQSIGQAVFGKPAGYNLGDDNIVRVTVRHLRARLEEFYRTEGKDEAYVLEIPKGKYIAFLVPRQQNAPKSDIVPRLASSEVVGSYGMPVAGPPSFKPSISGVAWSIVSILLVMVAILSFSLYRIEGKDSAKTNHSAGLGLLQLLTQRGNKLTVVVTDSNLQAYREIFKKEVSLDSYIDQSYVHPAVNDPLARTWRYVSGATETSLTSAIVAATIQKAAAPAVVNIRHPHDLSMRDFQSESLILLGGPWINPWGQMFEDKLNFQMVPPKDNPAGSEILNLNPKAGEPKRFGVHQENGLAINYVRIAVLPNLSKSGSIVLIGATGLESLEAGGDYLAAQKSLDDLLRQFRVSSAAQLPPFEVLLEVKGIRAVPGNVRVIAQRAVILPS